MRRPGRIIAWMLRIHLNAVRVESSVSLSNRRRRSVGGPEMTSGLTNIHGEEVPSNRFHGP